MKTAIIGIAYLYNGGMAANNERMAREFQLLGHEVEIFTVQRSLCVANSVRWSPPSGLA